MWRMKSVALRKMPISFVALGLLAGCGGGSGNGSGNVQGAVHQGSAGIGTFSFLGSPKPMLTTSSGQVTSVTMAGASFTNLVLHPNASLSNTDLVWSMSINGEDEIFKYNYPSGPAQPLTGVVPGYFGPSQSKFGSLYFSSSSMVTPYQMLVDGTHTKTLSTGKPYCINPTPNPAGTTLTFLAGDGLLCTCPVAGGTSAVIQTNVQGYGTSWSPTGTSIAYSGLVGIGGNILTTPVSGGSSTNVTPPALSNGYLQNPNWSPGGATIAAEYVASGGGNSAIVIMSALSPIDSNFITTPSTYSDYTPAYSPDGSKIAFYRSGVGGATAGIYTEDETGGNQQLIAPLPSGASKPDSLFWSPFPSPVTYVPNSSFYASPVSGFIQTENGTQFGSLLGFIAKTPSAATITTSATQGNQPLIFTLSADAITNIVYTNAYFSYATTVTPPASTPSALVTVDASTGAVDLVATAAKPQATFKPSTRSIGANLTYDGPFTAVYGPKGNRLDTSGANQIVVDGKTGKLISFN